MSLSHKDRISFLRETNTENTPQSSAIRLSPTKSSPFSNKSPFSLTGTPSSKMFFSNPVSPNIRTLDALQIVTSISDVNNSSQVGKAFDSVHNVKARIQLVDQIIKKRQEIKDAEDELKIEKATPIIHKLTVNFKKRLKKARSNDGKLSFHKTLLSLINEEESPLKLPQEGSKLNSPKKYLNTLLNVEGPEDSRQSSLLNLPNKKDVLSIKLDPLSQNPSMVEWGTNSCFSEGTTVQESQLFSPNKTLVQILGPTTMSKKTKNKVALLLRQSIEKPSELPLLEDERKETLEMSKIKISTRSRKSTATSLKEAKQEIEKDLYRYLVNNKESDTPSNILTLGTKKGSIGDIESRVQAKYKNHIDLKEKTDNYFVPKSFTARKTSVGNDEAPKQKTLNSFRSNTTVRHISYDVFSSSTPKKSERSMKFPKEPEIQPNDIYRKKLKNEFLLREMELKLGHFKSNSQAIKTEKKKVAKLQAFRNNSSDILRFSHKMITT